MITNTLLSSCKRWLTKPIYVSSSKMQHYAKNACEKVCVNAPLRFFLSRSFFCASFKCLKQTTSDHLNQATLWLKKNSIFFFFSGFWRKKTTKKLSLIILLFTKLPSVNFINILWAAFMPPDTKSAKKTVKLSSFFALLGSLSVKAARRTLVKLTPRVWILIHYLYELNNQS